MGGGACGGGDADGLRPNTNAKSPTKVFGEPLPGPLMRNTASISRTAMQKNFSVKFREACISSTGTASGLFFRWIFFTRGRARRGDDATRPSFSRSRLSSPSSIRDGFVRFCLPVDFFLGSIISPAQRVVAASPQTSIHVKSVQAQKLHAFFQLAKQVIHTFIF